MGWMTFPKECDVRSCSVFGDSVCCDSEADCFVCEAPNAWCHDMPEIWGNSVSEYVNYVGHIPDCVDHAIPDDVDGYPEGMLPSEAVCVVTDDMTYQEKIEALSGTIYDYDDVCDNLPDYFDYDDPYDCEELCGFDGSVECVMIPVNQMVVRLSYPKLGSVTCQMVLCPHRNRILTLSPDSDRPGETESHRTEFVLDSVTSSPMLCTHQNRRTPKWETDRPQ